jgi:hypothetical protein
MPKSIPNLDCVNQLESAIRPFVNHVGRNQKFPRNGVEKEL